MGYAPDPEGEGRLISAGEDGKVVVWKLGRDDPPHVLSGHDGAITALAVENGRVYTSSLDGSVRSWDLGQVLKKADLPGDSARLIKQAQVVAGRNLSLDECKKFFPNDPKYHRTFPDLPDGDGVTTSDLPRQAGDRSTTPRRFSKEHISRRSRRSLDRRDRDEPEPDGRRHHPVGVSIGELMSDSWETGCIGSVRVGDAKHPAALPTL